MTVPGVSGWWIAGAIVGWWLAALFCGWWRIECWYSRRVKKHLSDTFKHWDATRESLRLALELGKPPAKPPKEWRS